MLSHACAQRFPRFPFCVADADVVLEFIDVEHMWYGGWFNEFETLRVSSVEKNGLVGSIGLMSG
jgi:hypothetical protein